MPAKILIVDDSLTVRIMLKRLLSVVDFPVGTVMEADNGAKGLELAVAERPDLVMADLNMDGMSGVEMIGRIRAHDELRALPIVVISSEGNSDVINQLLAYGVSDFVRKPFDLAGVSEVLNKVLAGGVAA